jgi:beta-RFAP synthase
VSPLQIKPQLTNFVRVIAPARLHLGFLDLNGTTGRKFGSIGVAINSHKTIVEAHYSESEACHDAPKHIQKKLKQLIDAFFSVFSEQIPLPKKHCKLVVKKLIPEHAGLGSGTQLALAVGTALSRLYNINAGTLDIATALDRGARSGIGIATFNQGGFIVDGGLGPSSATPPLLARYTYPEEWRIVLIMESHSQGIHGTEESKAFKSLPPFPISQSRAICHLTLMKLLPALVEQDINVFGQSVTDIQHLIGDHFSTIQGGRYTSNSVATLLNYATELGHLGIAQTSWGPTGCVFVNNEAAATLLIGKLNDYIEQYFKLETDYSILMTNANSSGSIVERGVG